MAIERGRGRKEERMRRESKQASQPVRMNGKEERMIARNKERRKESMEDGRMASSRDKRGN